MDGTRTTSTRPQRRSSCTRCSPPSPPNLFLPDFLPFQQRIAWWKAPLNSLSQILLKFTSPGVPDIYQGNELWDYSLVDPDNRRAVDYGARRAALRSVKSLHAKRGCCGLRSAPAGDPAGRSHQALRDLENALLSAKARGAFPRWKLSALENGRTAGRARLHIRQA